MQTSKSRLALLVSACFLFMYAAAGLAAGEAGSKNFDPQQPTVLITGSNRGIGLAFARHYAGAGWNVIATARKPDEAAELQSLSVSHPQVAVVQLDVTDLARIAELGQELSGTPIDVLINNAAVLGDLPGQQYGSLDFDQFEWTMAVNVFGPMAMAEVFS
jgi:NAD(P)-dependent dehydrogenase (short-subunit alcohol dehydrogenase family)